MVTEQELEQRKAEIKEKRKAALAKAREAKKSNKEIELSENKTIPQATTPWMPAKKLDVPEDLKDPRFVYRFVNTRTEGNEMKKLAEGWEYDDTILAKMEARGLLPHRRAMNDGTPLGKTYTIRELVLMRIPKERAQARNEYYREKGERARRDFKKSFQSDVSNIDPRASAYGNSKEETVSRRI